MLTAMFDFNPRVNTMTPIVLGGTRQSIAIPWPARDGLHFSAPSGDRQKHINALIGALATGCKAPGLYGKKKPVFLIVYHIHCLNAIIDSVYKYFKLHSIYDNMESRRKEKNDR
jgi:hypothetical protein